MQLSRDTRLRRTSGYAIKAVTLTNSNVSLEGRSAICGPHLFAILDVFAQPRTINDALEALKGQILGVQNWIEIVTEINLLHDLGVLQDEHPLERPARHEDQGFGTASEQISMLNDTQRTLSYIAAIREIVKPGDVVVEIGTGTGVLTVAAAKAGAKHIYTIEATRIGDAALSMFEHNGVGDRITLVSGLSTHVSLPERADVLISEIIGNEPLGEGILTYTADALGRFLKPQFRMVPSRLQIFGLPLGVDPEVRAEYLFMPEAVHQWQQSYGINFEGLLRARPTGGAQIHLSSYDVRDWPTFSEPALLADIDLTSLRDTTINTTATAAITRDGLVDGVLLYFSARLGNRVWLSSAPNEVDENNSWNNALWLLPEPLDVAEGEILDMTYQYNVAGMMHGFSVSRRATTP